MQYYNFYNRRAIAYNVECMRSGGLRSTSISNRDGVAPFSGDGSTIREIVPFCPNCERKPQSGTFGHKGIQVGS